MRSVPATELAKMGSNELSIKKWSALPSFRQVKYRIEKGSRSNDSGVSIHYNMTDAQILGIIEHDLFHNETTKYQTAEVKSKLSRYHRRSTVVFGLCCLAVIFLSLTLQ